MGHSRDHWSSGNCLCFSSLHELLLLRFGSCAPVILVLPLTPFQELSSAHANSPVGMKLGEGIEHRNFFLAVIPPNSHIGCLLSVLGVSLIVQLVKNLPAMWETQVRSLGLGRSPGERNGYPLQYSGLENSMDCIVHGVAKSGTRLSDFHFHQFRGRQFFQGPGEGRWFQNDSSILHSLCSLYLT